MTSSLSIDVAVIGAGTAGLTAFSELGRQGLSAVLIDRGPLGTTCARVGCMPSKAALHAGHQWANLRALLGNAEWPREATGPEDLWRHARATRDQLASGTVRRTQELAGDKLIMGQARFVGPGLLEVAGQRIRAKAFIVATGSSPVVPKSLASLGEHVITTDTLFDLESLPRRVGMLGLGAIGLEMGLALSRLGVEVIAGDMKPLPAGIADPEIGAKALEHFGSELTMWLGEALEATMEGGAITLRSGGNATQVDKVLAALGRRPNVQELDLARAEVPLDERGQPVLDPRTLQAGKSAVFVAGDVSALRPLMHEAADEGLIAARAVARSLGAHTVQLPERRVPIGIVFSDPDIATVGRSYDALDLDQTVIGRAQGGANGRLQIMGAENNLLHVYADKASGRLLGASLITARGEHLAHLLAWAIQRGETVEGLLAMPYYHPTVEELLQSALKNAARQLRDA